MPFNRRYLIKRLSDIVRVFTMALIGGPTVAKKKVVSFKLITILKPGTNSRLHSNVYSSFPLVP